MTRFRSSRAAKKTYRRGGGFGSVPTRVAGYKLMKCYCPTERIFKGGFAGVVPPGHKMKRCLVAAPSEKHIYGGGFGAAWSIPPFWVFRECICPEGNRGGGAAVLAIPGYELKECLCPVERSGMGALSKRGRKTKKAKKGKKGKSKR